MSRDPRSSQPRYQHVAQQLRDALARGDYPAGQRMPGEEALAKEFGVAVGTVRQALGVLKSEGLIDSRQGSGVFVNAFTPIRRREVPGQVRGSWGSGLSVWLADDEKPLEIDEITVAEEEPTDGVARVLGLEGGQRVRVLGGRYSVSGRRVMLAWSRLDVRLAADIHKTQVGIEPEGAYARLAALDRKPVHYRVEVRSGAPTIEEMERLNLPAGRSVLRTMRTAFDAERRPVAIDEMVMDSAAIILEFEFPCG